MASQQKLYETQVELQKQKELNEKLETDLLMINNTSDQPTTDRDDGVLANLNVEERTVRVLITHDVPHLTFC